MNECMFLCITYIITTGSYLLILLSLAIVDTVDTTFGVFSFLNLSLSLSPISSSHHARVLKKAVTTSHMSVSIDLLGDRLFLPCICPLSGGTADYRRLYRLHGIRPIIYVSDKLFFFKEKIK
jgi:hypothetical protein